MPLRTASTPATNVVATAPMPGIMIPSFPLAGAISPAPVLLLSVGMPISPFRKVVCKLIIFSYLSGHSQLLGREWACLRVVRQSEGFGGKTMADDKSRSCDRKLQRHRAADGRRVGGKRLSRGRHHARSRTQRPPGRGGAESRRARAPRPAAARRHRLRRAFRAWSRTLFAITAASTCW